MAQIVKELRVDVSQPNVFQAIVAKQHDSNSRFLKITLVDFGVKVEVPNTAKVTINANRPDGASESFKGEANNDGTITVPLAQWMLDIDGEVKCDVSVTNTEDNKRLTSTDFWLEVQKAANPNASIPLDPDGEILIIKPVTEINGNSKDTDYPSAKAVYDYGQGIVTDLEVTKTATGSAITIESSQAPIPYLKLSGKTTKNGDTLTSTGDSGSFTVKIQGENVEEQSLTLTDTLRSVGDDKDEVDFNRGVKIQRVHSIIINSMSRVTIATVGGATRFDIYGLPKAKRAAVGMCNSLTVDSAPIGTNDKDNCITSFVAGGVFFRCDELANATDKNAWLTEHPIHLIYPLAEPIETPISETELNAYRQLMTNSGTTNILSEADMTLDYYVNKPNAQAIGNIHSQVNKDYFKLQQAIISTGGSTL